ncbi:glycosyltransferase [Cereibacter sphaeroides]|uniref:glycosyltransferase family 2 protein n=1 Tax=Cereibacter sphaeroides TaxID=1063 RepID=UPI001F4384DE|nr:glycosyltransferase family 2 protein [Cereibacter sphaeroides]MCE6960017.1 glycosyltransferase [Cereibacter sphaeroides]MCE6968560.1 glycosyltransferase [Cereibacter sphaeroides]MCE6973102.1 glycosyltransferase [Cereibacter sphaeroides]
MNIAVIIPFYQRERGILSRALDSVEGQDLPAGMSLTVFIVDDASPVPASVELAGRDSRVEIRLIEQANGGPGAARNAGLDAVAKGAFDHVAFLDSDDIWAPSHLRDALALLERGYDFHFCDHQRTDDDITYFQRTATLRRLRDERHAGVTVIDADVPILAFDQKTIMAASVETYLSQTSTIVIRQRFVQELRFDVTLRNAGEDQLYWLSLIAAGARTVVSWKMNVHCGRGVNVYFDAFDWTSTKVVDRTGYMLMFFHTLARRLSLSPSDRETVSQRVTRYRRAYSYLFLRALLQGRIPTLALMWKLAALDPGLIPAMPLRFLAVLPRRKAESLDW